MPTVARRGIRTPRVVVAVVILATVLTACAPAQTAPTRTAPTRTAPARAAPPDALPAGVEVELYQLRSDVAERGAQVRIVNGSDDDLAITRVTFDDDWFAAPSIRARESTIPAGRTVDLRIALPESACDEEPDAATRTRRVTLEFSVAGAAGDAPRTATVDVADPLGFTDLVHEKECLRHDLATLITLGWTSFTPSAAPLPAQLVLSLTAAGDAGSGAVVQVETTNLLQFSDLATPFALGVDLPLASPQVDVPVPLVPLRCDPHAVMEDKRGTVFNVAVRIDGVPGVVEVAAPETMRGEILRWVADWCGFGPG